MSKKLLIIGGKAWSIINFRGSLIKKLVKEGYEVTAVSSDANKLELKQIKNLGVKYIDIKLKSNTINVFKDIAYYLKLKSLILNLNNTHDIFIDLHFLYFNSLLYSITLINDFNNSFV